MRPHATLTIAADLPCDGLFLDALFWIRASGLRREGAGGSRERECASEASGGGVPASCENVRRGGGAPRE
jgi:hypothetical protein